MRHFYQSLGGSLDRFLRTVAIWLVAGGGASTSGGEEPQPHRLWLDLLSFRPAELIQKQVMAHREAQLQFLGQGPSHINWFVQRIEDGVWPVEFDYYPVWVRELPDHGGRRPMTVEELVSFVKFNLNGLTPPNLARFEPYNYTAVCRRMELGGYVYIIMGSVNLGNAGGGGQFVLRNPLENGGSVVISLSEPRRWRFSTIYANGHRYLDDGGKNHPGSPRSQTSSGGFYHPVSGNREFGVVPHRDGGWIFYTAGVDRLSKWSFVPESVRDIFLAGTGIDVWVEIGRTVPTYAAQQMLWKGFQERLVDFVNRAGGKAELLKVEGGESSVRNFIEWELAKSQGIFRPSVSWIDNFGDNGKYWADRAPTRDSVLPEILKALDQIDTGSDQNDPPRRFERPAWMEPFISQMR